LITVEAGVVENLPLLSGALVSCNFFVLNTGLAYDLLNPVLELNEHFLISRVVFHSAHCSVVKSSVVLVIVVVVIVNSRSEVLAKKTHLLLLALETLSELVKGFVASSFEVGIINILLQFWLGLVEQSFIVRAFSWVISVQLRNLRDIALSLSRVFVVESLLDGSNVKLRLSEWSLPVVLVEVEMVINVQSTRARCWVSVLDSFGRLIVFVSMNVNALLHTLPHVLASL